MGYIKEKVAYAKGLADGLSVGEASKEGRVLSAILDILEEMADSVEENECALADINECVEHLIEDTDALNSYIFDDEDEVTLECPHCGEISVFDSDEMDDDEDLLCQHCQQPIMPDFEIEDEE